jgi:Lar family restriction alleviation protein
MNICNYCEYEKTCTNKPLATTRCKDYKKMSEELKPCPFCGYGKILQNSGDGYFVSCMKCGSRGSKKKYYETMSDAITAWNTRPIEDEKDREIAELKKELNEVLKMQSENYGSGMTTHLKLLLWASKYRTRNKTWGIETGKDNDVLANPTDNDVGSMENLKGGIK